MSKGPQSFGGAGGGGARVTVLLTGSPFSTLAALEAYSAANPSELLNNTDQVSLAVVNSDGANNGTYEYSGVSGVYVTGQWVMFSGLDASDIKKSIRIQSGHKRHLQIRIQMQLLALLDCLRIQFQWLLRQACRMAHNPMIQLIIWLSRQLPLSYPVVVRCNSTTMTCLQVVRYRAALRVFALLT